VSQVSLALLIHAHQPVGNFDHIIEDACAKSYAPFLSLLSQHPDLRVSLHFSGCLLEWIENHHPDLIGQLRLLAGRGQIELVGGGFYEPIFPAIPDRDKIAQIQKLSGYLRRTIGRTPRGAWVTERVWEPGLARPLAEAGVGYSVLDDTHFLAAGLEPRELHGVYITEDVGCALRLVPSLKSLRYTIPFREPEETLDILRQAQDLPHPLVAVGDDYEKFGGWPGTFDHCYKNGWLERFFRALEGEAGWLKTTTLSDYIDSCEPLGRIYLPATSYDEMGQWALPPPAAREFRACIEESRRLPSSERFQAFLRGGLWRNFFAKYAEANQLHKLMLDVSDRLHEAENHSSSRAKPRPGACEAKEHLLAGQCNDAYWHGIFGGLYSPHLRYAVLHHLIQAESFLDKARPRSRNSDSGKIRQRDFDVDGRDEILVNHPQFGMVVNPSDGATVSSLRFKPAATELINSLMRRPEAYHDLVRQAAAGGPTPQEGPSSIHDILVTKGAHLEALLQYDRYSRYGFRTYLFPAAKQWQDFAELTLRESGELAGGKWDLLNAEPLAGEIRFSRSALVGEAGAAHEIETTKVFRSKVARRSWELECRTSMASRSACTLDLALGTELIFNLLAPNAPDRYFSAEKNRYPLEFRGEIEAEELSLTDKWQKLSITLLPKPHCRWWIVPIETISQSESGFERVYQGSAILAVWKAGPPPWEEFSCSLRAKVAAL
jgi:4-alpha-glucanotransferase